MFNPRKSMLDDERYPIAVFPDEFVPQIPQSKVQLPAPPPVAYNGATRNVFYAESVTATSPVSSMGRSAMSTAETAYTPSSTPSVMYQIDPTMYKGEEQWRTPAFDSELLRASPARSNSIWKQFNVWKVLIFAFMAFATGVVVTTVVLNKTKASNTKSTTAAAAAATNTTMTTTLALSTTTDSVASSGLYLQDKTTWNMQLYYLPANTTQILYRMNLDSSGSGSKFEAAQNMTLSVPPKLGSPLTATASTDTTGVVYLDVFYITSANYIAQAHLACSANSSICTTVTNAVISQGAQALHSMSSLVAVNVDHAQDWRIYYQNANHNIVELAGNSSGFNQGVTIYSGTTLTASSLTAVNINKSINNINVFFVDHDSQALYYTQFTSTWQTALPVTKEVIKTWNPTSSLASAYASTPGWIRLYFVGTDSKVWEYIGYNATSTNTTWEVQPGTAPIWASTNSTQDITATAFKDQVRWWQYDPVQGLLEAALDNTTWTENKVL